MTSVSIGDLAQSFQLRAQNAHLKRQLTTLAQELTSGRKADPGAHLSGDFVPLASIERGLATLASYRTALSEAAIATDAMQASLAQLADTGGALAEGLLLSATAPGPATLTAGGIEARGRLEQAVSALNASVGGRALFSGAAVGQPALAPADQIIAALEPLVAGETTAEGVANAVAAWFDTPGGGFDTLAYTGADTPAGPVRVADGQSLTLDVTAADPAMRDVLKGLATAALLADEGLLADDLSERAALAQRAGEQLITAEAPLAALRAEIGIAQNRIETIKAENGAETAMLELARGELIGADPYDTATGLEAVQGQLETLYTITARLARLSLVDFL